MSARHTARIVAVGDELLLGRTVDTNSAWLADWCVRRGFTVTGVTIVPDEEDRLVHSMRDAAVASDLVLVTGGLGPTEDDRTRHALALAMEAPLQESAEAWEQVRSFWSQRLQRGGDPPASNRRQALVPRGAKLLRNDRGTAPGLLGYAHGAWLACMPGVPHEMQAMAERLADDLPALIDDVRLPAIGEVHFAGLGESTAQDLLGDLLSGDAPRVGITAHEAGHITVRAVGGADEVERRCAAVREVLADHLVLEAGLAPSLVARLAAAGQTVTAAESCTCGHVAAMLGAVPGVSSVLRQAFVTYHDEAKQALVGVDPADLTRDGAVSEAVVRSMATGALAAAGADLALATSGIAGPDGGTEDKPVGTVWLAAATPERVVAKLTHVRGDRGRIQRRAAASALLLGWQLLVGSA